MHYFSHLFDKVLYMFRTGPLSIIRSISTLYTRNRYLSCCIYIYIYVCVCVCVCWLSAGEVSSILTTLADSQQN